MIEEYWSWFSAKSGRKTGYRLLFSRWTLLDLGVAAALTIGLKLNGFEFAQKALFPAASILAGMAFAWTSRASTILNNAEFRDRIIGENNPLSDYVYGFQTSILILFCCVVYIAIMAAGGFSFSFISDDVSVFISSFWMYFLISITIRECWSVINFTNLLTLLDDHTRDRPTDKDGHGK
ncbi:hypothetical protein [Qipengyuania seohaensis]|uniref:hypothetical protein n=1 Tax=Qipengyuania seohaensis TaxID=266951 RepID=UPI000C229AA8|nr:hypothetical protein [Qipengyuania seohaensis]